MDFALFSKCLDLYCGSFATKDKQRLESKLKGVVGNLFYRDNRFPPSVRTGSLLEDFRACSRLNAAVSDLTEILKNLDSHLDPSKNPKSVNIENAYVFAYLVRYETKYREFEGQVAQSALGTEGGFDNIEQRYKKLAEKALKRAPQPRLTDPLLDTQYEQMILHYAYDENDKIAVLGRDAEQAELREFL